jgi:hypothetical protein
MTEPAGRPSFLGRPTGRLILFPGSIPSIAPAGVGFFTLPLGRPGLRLIGTAGSPPFWVGFEGAPACCDEATIGAEVDTAAPIFWGALFCDSRSWLLNVCGKELSIDTI